MSVKVKNVSPFGDLEAPFVGLLGFGEVVDVADEHAALLLVQPFHYAPGDKAAEAFLKSLAAPADADPAAPADVPGEGEPA